MGLDTETRYNAIFLSKNDSSSLIIGFSSSETDEEALDNEAMNLFAENYPDLVKSYRLSEVSEA
jgi:hypothetical protein